MRPAKVIIGEICHQDAHQVPLVQDNDVVQTLAADAADQPLHVWILPGRARRREDLFDAEVGGGAVQGFAVTAIAVVKQEARRRVERERLRDLAGDPSGGVKLLVHTFLAVPQK
jgi:hypothetical protein